MFRTSKNVELRELLGLQTKDGMVSLEIKINADFATIPDEYHEVFLNMMTTRYYGKVSFGDNPFSRCLPPKQKKWYQFWKK
jgi:hypothetical protein